VTIEALSLDELRHRRDQINAAAHRWGGQNVRIFGSVARGEATAASDVDVLVLFEDGRSLLDLVHLADDLRALLGRSVDVVSEGGLLERDQHILDEAVAL
jgi:predicted nucleotidyltransferase